MSMHVVKRDGRTQSVHFDKITSRITKLAFGLDPKVRWNNVGNARNDMKQVLFTIIVFLSQCIYLLPLTYYS